MGARQVTVEVDAGLAEQAERYAGEDISSYAKTALREKVLRDAAAAYRTALEENPQLASDVARVRAFASRNARAGRERAWAAERAE